jgi:hypothetical protein
MNNSEGLFIKRITDGEDIHKVYNEVFQADRSLANNMIQEPEIKEAITERLKANGITEHKIHKTLRKQLDAKKVMYVDPKLSRVEVDDNDAQLKATTIGYKLLGLMKDNQVNIDNRQVTFSSDPKLLADIVLEMQKLKADAVIDTTGEVV